MQIHSVVQINKQMYTKTIIIQCADNKVFLTYQTQWRELTPSPLCTPLVSLMI